jgi:hypothetical protein
METTRTAMPSPASGLGVERQLDFGAGGDQVIWAVAVASDST